MLKYLHLLVPFSDQDPMPPGTQGRHAPRDPRQACPQGPKAGMPPGTQDRHAPRDPRQACPQGPKAGMPPGTQGRHAPRDPRQACPQGPKAGMPPGTQGRHATMDPRQAYKTLGASGLAYRQLRFSSKCVMDFLSNYDLKWCACLSNHLL